MCGIIPFQNDIAGGFGKLSKLAEGHMDLHSKRSQVDFALASLAAELTDEEPRWPVSDG